MSSTYPVWFPSCRSWSSWPCRWVQRGQRRTQPGCRVRYRTWGPGQTGHWAWWTQTPARGPSARCRQIRPLLLPRKWMQSENKGKLKSTLISCRVIIQCCTEVVHQSVHWTLVMRVYHDYYHIMTTIYLQIVILKLITVPWQCINFSFG